MDFVSAAQPDGTQTQVTDGSFHAVTAPTILVNHHGLISGTQFQVPAGGRGPWRVTGFLALTGDDASVTCDVEVAKNGTRVQLIGTAIAVGTGHIRVNIHACVYAIAGDYFEVRIKPGGATFHTTVEGGLIEVERAEPF